MLQKFCSIVLMNAWLIYVWCILNSQLLTHAVIDQSYKKQAYKTLHECEDAYFERMMTFAISNFYHAWEVLFERFIFIVKQW